MCARVSWVRLRTSGWAAARYSANTIRLSARRLDGVRPQRGRHGGQVAQRGLADAGLADRLHPLGDGRLAGPGLPRRMLADPQLVAGLVQAEHAGGVVHPGVVARAGRLGQGRGEGGEVVVGRARSRVLPAVRQTRASPPRDTSRVQFALQPNRWATSATRCTSPGWRAPTAGRGRRGSWRAADPGRVAGGLRRNTRSGTATPRCACRSASRAGVGRVIHAASCGWIASRRPAALRRIRRAVRADRQRGDRVGVGDQQIRRPLAAQRDGGRGAHRAAARARAYSAASVSGDRCT